MALRTWLRWAAIALPLIPPALHAQHKHRPKPATAPAAVEEITVTATRRSSAIGRVPISVTAFSQATLDAKGARDISDVVRFTPGVSFDPVTNNVSIPRHRVGSRRRHHRALYRRHPRAGAQPRLQRREHPARNCSIWNAWRYCAARKAPCSAPVPKAAPCATSPRRPACKPTANTPAPPSRPRPTGAPSFDLGAAIGGPIIQDVLGFRVSVSHEYDGGYLDHVNYQTNAVTARNTNSTDITSFRGALAWQPFAGLLITPSVFYQQRLKDDTDAYFENLSNPGAGIFRVNSPEYVRDHDRFYLPAINAKWDLNGVSVISNTSWLHRNNLTG